MVRLRPVRSGLIVMAVSGALAITASPATWANPTPHTLTAAQQQALKLGIQIAPKAGQTKAKSKTAQPNPMLANVPDAAKVDYSAWHKTMAKQASQRAVSQQLKSAKIKAAGKALAPAFVHDEEEPAGTDDSNDSRVNAELVSGFGTGKGKNPRVRILGEIADLTPPSEELPTVNEDNGELDLAGDTGIDGSGAITTTGVLGDGPHGTSGDKTNDFDFYELSSAAGQTITVDTTASPENTDTVVVIYNAAGTPLAANDDSGLGLSSYLTFAVPAAGTYYVLVAGFSESGPLPRDPHDSGSGTGGASAGPYDLSISVGEMDSDFYALDLAKGDVVGATVTGSATKLSMYRYDGIRQMTSDGLDASALYAPESPLPGGGNTTAAFVAEKAGRYAVRVDGLPGRYDATVEAYRPGSEVDTSKNVQTVYLDFRGGRVNTGIWGGKGVSEVSPFSAFITKWGLNKSQEATLIDRITAGVRENIRQDLIAKGQNKNLAVEVVNSKNSADIFGRTNVSRVIVGGTIDQTGLPTIGVAQFIDVGNYAHEDSAIVLLDSLSGPATDDYSLNKYLRPGVDRVGFVSRALSNVISHEIGHLIGNYHTANLNSQHSLMDSGGANFNNLFGTGPDKIGGTADDEDVDFVSDTFAPEEGFTGREDTLNTSAWAFVRGKNVIVP